MALHSDPISQFLANKSGIAVSPGLTQTVGQEDLGSDGPFGKAVQPQQLGRAPQVTGVPAAPGPIDSPSPLISGGDLIGDPPTAISPSPTAVSPSPTAINPPIPSRSPLPNPAARVGGSSPLPSDLGQANQGVVGIPQPASAFAGPPNDDSPLLQMILQLIQSGQIGENEFRGRPENLVSP